MSSFLKSPLSNSTFFSGQIFYEVFVWDIYKRHWLGQSSIACIHYKIKGQQSPKFPLTHLIQFLVFFWGCYMIPVRFLLFIPIIALLNGYGVEARIRRYKWEVKNEFKSPDCYRKLVITINGRTPGPTIRAQQNDTIVVEVANSLFTENIAIHWHGIRQVLFFYFLIFQLYTCEINLCFFYCLTDWNTLVWWDRRSNSVSNFAWNHFQIPVCGRQSKFGGNFRSFLYRIIDWEIVWIECSRGHTCIMHIMECKKILGYMDQSWWNYLMGNPNLLHMIMIGTSSSMIGSITALLNKLLACLKFLSNGLESLRWIYNYLFFKSTSVLVMIVLCKFENFSVSFDPWERKVQLF